MTKNESLILQVREFVKARDWEQFHSPKNLSMALSVEVSELLECFQWLNEDDSYHLKSKQLENVTDEIADVQIYLMLLADKLNINIHDAVVKKIDKNKRKYPIDKSKGNSKKHTEL